MALIRRSTMVPFISIKAGEYYVCIVKSRQEIAIKGEQRDTVTLEVYYVGKTSDGVPPEETLKSFFQCSPTLVLIGAHKAIVDGLFSDPAYNPLDKRYYLAYGGVKSVAGAGKKFNQWEIVEIA